ncbi:NAD(P)H-binding protein [Paenibacillus dendritiformis]|uniref:NAD(P)-dependent oxidoreductase n=1 Tax=Paenibacillus dendritiformis TaxID=130049 RepID=UPI00143D265D|nr:NAD(P)H-binding protein [Paenibacillus dendritiformis]NKI22164.1 NAD(P)H-binding protein [Paenibacillus dendritiformis]NRF98075.1 NAD(P)H-binding protein [Paenibacillus dendritiformis]
MEQIRSIALIGGNGKVGRHIARTAAEKGYHVRMLTRRPANMPSAVKLIEIREGDAQDIQTIRELLQDCDAVINTLGQPVRAVPIYSIVTSQLLEVMQEYGMRRYIGVSGGSLDVPGDKKRLVNRIGARAFDLFFPQLMADKRKELDILLQNQHIDWSLVRLPFVKDGPCKGNIKVNLYDMPGSSITNSDIAAFLIRELEDPAWIRQTPFISH